MAQVAAKKPVQPAPGSTLACLVVLTGCIAGSDGRWRSDAQAPVLGQRYVLKEVFQPRLAATASLARQRTVYGDQLPGNHLGRRPLRGENPVVPVDPDTGAGCLRLSMDVLPSGAVAAWHVVGANPTYPDLDETLRPILEGWVFTPAATRDERLVTLVAIGRDGQGKLVAGTCPA